MPGGHGENIYIYIYYTQQVVQERPTPLRLDFKTTTATPTKHQQLQQQPLTYLEIKTAVRSARSFSSGPRASSAVLVAPPIPTTASSSSSNGDTRACCNPPVPSSVSNSAEEVHLPTPRHMTRYCPPLIIRASLISRMAPEAPVAGLWSGNTAKRRVPDRHRLTRIM